MTSKKYKFRLQDEATPSPYDEEFDSLTIREQTRALEETPVEDLGPGRVRRLVGWTLYVTSVALDWIAKALHDWSVHLRQTDDAYKIRWFWMERR